MSMYFFPNFTVKCHELSSDVQLLE